MRKVAFLVLLLSALASPVRGIVIRHDRDDERYRRLAESYPMVCRVGGGMGTLIDPEWVLTAAHVAESVSGDGVVRFGERTVGIADVVLHPDYADPRKHRDLGLLRLSEPMYDITPARLYRAGEEQGLRAVFVGDGLGGTGETGPRKGERILRAAHNVVDSVSEGWLTFIFDAPPSGEDLEGISGPGDSGGPALIEVDGSWEVIGVSAYNDGGELCRYGTVEHYCRVSDELEWIEGVLAGRQAAGDFPRIMRYHQRADGEIVVTREAPETVPLPAESDPGCRRVVRSLAEALNQGDREAYLALFTPRLLEDRMQAGDPLAGMVDFMQGVREARGPITAVHLPGREGVRIPDSTYPMRPIVFHLADGTPGYFGISLDEEGRIDHLSLFVKEGLCREPSPCPITVPLEELEGDR